MGNNAAFSAMEQTVVGIYKTGKLDKDILSACLEPYRDCDIDSGGKEGLISADGLEVEDIVIKIFTGKVIPLPKVGKDYTKWTDDENSKMETYHERRDSAFRKITDKFGWC